MISVPMKKILLLSLLSLSLSGFSQDMVLKGKIIDKSTSLPLSGASVIYGSDAGTVSDIHGEFSLPCAGSLDITISFVGYQTHTQHVNDCNAFLSIELDVSTSILDNVE